jgi:D-beta-D-heptose 7-phosphate kinase/D-beta-D-heptose 1-phosphate adenosyltransferase
MANPSIKAILQGGSGLDGKYIPDFDSLEAVVKLLRDSGYSIVLTMGVYDMFHVGHKRYLEAASKLGDVLIVGVDSDELTREMKGHIDPNRPFDTFETRIEMLAALSFIKIVTRRHNDRHIDDLIKTVSPDVLVISKTTSTFTDEKVAEIGLFCKKIEHLDAQADPNVTSTTAKLRRLKAEGGRELAERVTAAVKTVVADFLGVDVDKQ